MYIFKYSGKHVYMVILKRCIVQPIQKSSDSRVCITINFIISIIVNRITRTSDF